MRSARTAVLVALSALVLFAAVTGPSVASSQPEPVCPVCADTTAMWDDSGWSPPDGQAMTVLAHENGTATWVVDLRWDTPEEAPSVGDADEIASMADQDIDEFRYLEAHENVAVKIGDDRARIAWQTPGVVTERLGHGVFRTFHGEGFRQPLAVNVDELVVRAPDGQFVTNDPAVGAVTDDGTAVSVDGPDQTVGEFYVVFGDDRGGVSAVTTELAIGSLLWPIMGENLLSFLFLPTVTFGVGLAGLYAAGRRWGADPGRAEQYGVFGLAAGVVVSLGHVVGPGAFETGFFLPATLLALVAVATFGYATAVGDRQLLVATAVAVPIVGLAPFLAILWPAVTLGPILYTVTFSYTNLAVGVVVLGVPWFLYGMALGQRRGAAR